MNCHVSGIGSFGQKAHEAGTEPEIVVHEMEQDDPQTKFYKQHMRRSEVPDMAGRISARDLDDWTSQQISKSFRQNQRLREIREEHKSGYEEAKFRLEGLNMFAIGLVLCFLIPSLQLFMKKDDDYDTPKTPKR